ncbi:MAG: polysulfide reductase [Bacteroidetes bacterium GWE2_42_24]|nr:MAG: polysulfide reductase [Bacteroidetes bacterium GWE2_42_24]OFY27584.1 MAG: polysulfide reductase [Bacteroidetes bacterium GWF2_43_11]
MTHHKGFELWILFLILIFIVGGYAYFIQLRDGLGVTAMRDYSSWGMYIGNFVFFVAASLIGMFISSVLGLLKIKWITPITRIAEMIALAFAMWAGIVIVIDMGRPDRLLNVFLHGRFQSPILWDVTVVSTYVAISLLLLLLPLIPDAAIIRRRLPNLPKWQMKIYDLLYLGWEARPEQYRIIKKAMRILAILIIPVALAIHTVTSWLFAATLRAGWDSAIFGPYFVSGAFVAGVAAVIIAMYFFRYNYKLSDYITDFHFNRMGQVLVLVSAIYIYFNLNEYFVPAYKMRTAEKLHLDEMFTGHWAILYWFTQIACLAIPSFLLIFKRMRRPFTMLWLSVLVLIGAWLKRFLIVVPVQQHPYLPIQNVPESFHHYIPTGIEITLTILPFAGVLLIITIIAKLFPVISVWEIAHEKGVDESIIK